MKTERNALQHWIVRQRDELDRRYQVLRSMLAMDADQLDIALAQADLMAVLNIMQPPKTWHANEWIDVETQLPDAEETVLIYMPNAEVEPVWPGYFDYYGDRCWCVADGMPAGRVTHWKPFPLPPEGEK